MGTLICLTGADGSGKSTQIDLLQKALGQQGYRVHRAWCRWKPLIPRPFMALAKGTLFRKTAVKDYNVGTEEGERFHAWQDTKRSVFRSGVLRRAYFALAVFDYLIQVWWRVGRGLLARRVVLADRYLCDLVIDQSLNFGQSVEELVRMMQRPWTRLFPTPRLVIYLDLSEEVALERRDDIPSLDYLRERRTRYHALCEAMGYSVVDANRTIDQVHAGLMDHVRDVL